MFGNTIKHRMLIFVTAIIPNYLNLQGFFFDAIYISLSLTFFKKYFYFSDNTDHYSFPNVLCTRNSQACCQPSNGRFKLPAKNKHPQMDEFCWVTSRLHNSCADVQVETMKNWSPFFSCHCVYRYLLHPCSIFSFPGQRILLYSTISFMPAVPFLIF